MPHLPYTPFCAASDFGALDTLSWVTLAFMLPQTAMTPLTGRFCDIYGRKATLLFSMGAFIVGSLACALSTTIVQLFVFRAIQGIGGGGIMVSPWAHCRHSVLLRVAHPSVTP